MERAESKTILELLHYAGKQEATSKDAQVVGDRAADIWRTVLPDDPPAKVEQIEEEETMLVNTYPREYWPVILNIISRHFQEKRATRKGLGKLASLSSLRAAIGDTTGKKPRRKRVDTRPKNTGLYGQI